MSGLLASAVVSCQIANDMLGLKSNSGIFVGLLNSASRVGISVVPRTDMVTLLTTAV